MIDYKFSLELTKNGVQKSIHAKASEENARRMIITLTVNGNVYDITDHKVRVFFHDGTYVDTASVEDGRIVFILPEALTSFAGEKTCEFKIYRDEEFVNVIYSPMVAIIVEGRVSDKEETELIGKKFEYQETIPNLPSADSIADDDEIAVYDYSVGKTVRILWSKIKGLFVSSKEIEDTNKNVDDVKKQVETNTKDIEKIDKKLDPLEKSVESLDKSAHSHTNKTNVLDELGVNKDNNLTFKGKEIKSSAGNQADFRQSNSEKADYIRNKPCYEYGYYLDSADGVEVDYLSLYDDEQRNRETFRKAIKVCDSLENPSVLLSFESDQIEFENKNEKLNRFGFDWLEDEDLITSFYCGIEYIKNTIERRGDIVDGEQLTVTLSPGLYYYVDDVVEQDSRVKRIFIPTETKKLPKRLLPESLGRSGIKSKTYDGVIGANMSGTGIVDFVIQETEEGFFENKVIVDVTWEDDVHGYVDTGVLIDNNLLDGYCVASVLNRPVYAEILEGYCVFRLYSPELEGYAGYISNGVTVAQNITIKYIEV